MKLDLVDVGKLDVLEKVAMDSYIAHFHYLWTAEGLKNYVTKTYSYSILERELNNTDIEYYLCYSEDEPIGFLKLIFRDHSIIIDKLYFLEHKTGKGYGGKCMDFILRRAGARDAKQAELLVSPENKGGIRFYQKHGFKSNKYVDFPTDKGEYHLMRMVQKLDFLTE